MSKLEKVARIMGRTVFRDLREGFGGSLTGRDTDEDVKFALGVARTNAGALSVWVFETKYASTIIHEGSIARAYDQNEAVALPPHFRRISATLAVRCYAGLRMQRPDFERWAWLLHVRRRTVEEAVDDCTSWLDNLCGDAAKEFLIAIGARRLESRRRRVDGTEKVA